MDGESGEGFYAPKSGGGHCFLRQFFLQNLLEGQFVKKKALKKGFLRWWFCKKMSSQI